MTLLGYRFKKTVKSSGEEVRAIFTTVKEFSLDNLEKLGDSKNKESIKEVLTNFSLTEKQMVKLRKAFFSPYYISESMIESGYSVDPVKPELIKQLFKELPQFSKFAESLPDHLTTPELQLNKAMPKPGKIIFAKNPISLKEILHEALKWHLAGKYFLKQGDSQKALKIFMGIIDLAIAYENNRLSHPDKERRRNSCFLREIAAVSLIQNAEQLASTKAELVQVLSELKKKSDSFVSMKNILAQDKLIPLQFGKQISDEAAQGKTEAKYSNKLTRISDFFGNKKEVSRYLDPVYDPLTKALSNPYWKAQRAFSPWYQAFKRTFADFDADSDWSTIKLLLLPSNSMPLHLLKSFSANLPFYVLIDVKTRQLIEGAKASLIIYTYKKENGKWPASLKELQTWLGQKTPIDLIRSRLLIYRTKGGPHLSSIGRDGRGKSKDDLVFIPFGQKVIE